MILLPLPATRDGITLNAPLARAPILLDSGLAQCLKGCTVLGGMAGRLRKRSPLWETLPVMDYYAREELTLGNAFLTAEGAVALAVEHSPGALGGSRCLVAGFGRIGKALCLALRGLGAQVDCAARKPWDLAAIRAPVSYTHLAETFERARPATTAAMLKYLASGTVKGVGPALARRIIDTFGDKALEVMEKDPERLAQIKGITTEKAKALGEELKRVYGIRELMMFLGAYGVRPEETVLVWKQFGEASIACIQEDPYCLCGEGLDISFDIADAIAESMEKPRDDEGRVQAGVLYVLRHNLNNGHTCLPADKLEKAAAQLLSVDLEAVQDALYTLCQGFYTCLLYTSRCV